MAEDEDYDPFTDKDMERIFHEEQSSSAEDGWVLVKKDDLIEVWRKKVPNQAHHLIKGFVNFQNIPPNAVSDMILDVEARPKWDKLFPVIDVLETHKHYRVIYWLSKLPFGITDRDLVQNTTHRYDESTNTSTFLYSNTTHPDRPERRGITRAETILSGVIVRPHPDDPNSTRMSILFQQDMKGWIPHSLTNAVATRAPGDWHESLSNYYWNSYSKQKSQKEDGSSE